MASDESPQSSTAPSAWTVHVDRDLCEAHALCLQIAPDVFDLPDDEIATSTPHPDDVHWPAVRSAVDTCPRQAISITTGAHSGPKGPRT